jgi:uncharacterized membrane protein YgdD (TMEM256/DUF423 family)
MKSTPTLKLAAFFCGTAVALGAFAAHGLKEVLDAYSLSVFETGVRYQLFHGLALFSLGGVELLGRDGQFRVSRLAWTLGICIFSGSLYILALSGVRWWGAITPIGGIMFLVGWLGLWIGAKSK